MFQLIDKDNDKFILLDKNNMKQDIVSRSKLERAISLNIPIEGVRVRNGSLEFMSLKSRIVKSLAFSETIEIDGVVYYSNENGIKMRLNEETNIVYIPPFVNHAIFRGMEFKSIKLVGGDGLTSCYSMFVLCQNLVSIDFTDFNTDNVNNMCKMLDKCFEIQSIDLSSLNLNNVETMNGMFTSCSSLKNIKFPSNMNTHKLQDMQGMFNCCSSLEKMDLSIFNTSKVTTMNSIFRDCGSLKEVNLNGLNTGSLEDVGFMFSGCLSLSNIDLTNFNTSSIVNMSRMFENSGIHHLDLSSFNTSKVNNTSCMFSNCLNLSDLDISGFDTRNIKEMYNMFADCMNLINLNLGNFDTSSVINISGMFRNCKSLKVIDISSFDLSNVDNSYYLKSMFSGCDAKIIGKKKIKVKGYPHNNESLCLVDVVDCAMFVIKYSRSKSDYYYVALSSGDIKNLVQMGHKIKNLRVKDDSIHHSAYYDKVKSHLLKNGSFKASNALYITSGGTNFDFEVEMDIKKVSGILYIPSFVTHVKFSSCDCLNLKVYGGYDLISCKNMFANLQSLESLDLSEMITSSVETMRGMFRNCLNLKELNISNLQTGFVADMSEMFENCKSLRKIDVRSFETKFVKSTDNIFSGCDSSLEVLGKELLISP